MRTNKKQYRRGHIWAIVLTAMATLACGLVIGFMKGAGNRGPSKQSVIDFLSRPVPVPAGAKLLATIEEGRGTSDETVRWRQDYVLDVSSMNPNDYEKITEVYAKHFDNHFQFGSHSSGARRSLASFGEGFSLSTGPERAQLIENRGEHYSLRIEAELIDFERKPPVGGFRKQQLVRDWTTPPADMQRVLWLRVSFEAYGVVGPGTWPGTPTTASTTNSAL